MITLESVPDNIIAVRFTDVVERSDIETLKTAVAERLKGGARLGLLVDLSQWSDITADAILEEIRFELANLENLARFGRMAFVSDKQFIWAVAGVLNALVGTTEVRSFASANHAQALAFVSELPVPGPQPLQKVARMETGDPRILAFRLEGTVGAGDVEPMVQALRSALERRGRIDMLVDVTNYEGFDPAVLATPGLIAMKVAAIRGVRRYAIVGAKDWLRRLAGFLAPVLPVDIRQFDAGAEAEALRWLRS